MNPKLVTFRYFSVLAHSLVYPNIQFLSFRAFQQIFHSGSPLTQSSTLMYYLNYIAAYLSLFFVTVYASGGHLLLRIFLRKKIKIIIHFMSDNYEACVYFTVSVILKMVSGFLHAALYKDTESQISYLIGVQLTMLVTIVIYHSVILSKIVRVLLVIEYIFRLIINLFLGIQVYLHGSKLADNVTRTFGHIEVTLMCIVSAIVVFQIMFPLKCCISQIEAKNFKTF